VLQALRLERVALAFAVAVRAADQQHPSPEPLNVLLKVRLKLTTSSPHSGHMRRIGLCLLLLL
jgi:hypothetical protein